MAVSRRRGGRPAPLLSLSKGRPEQRGGRPGEAFLPREECANRGPCAARRAGWSRRGRKSQAGRCGIEAGARARTPVPDPPASKAKRERTSTARRQAGLTAWGRQRKVQQPCGQDRVQMSGSVRPHGTTRHPGCSSRWRSGSVPSGSGPPRSCMSCRENDDDVHTGFVDRAVAKRPRMVIAYNIRSVQRSRGVLWRLVPAFARRHRGRAALRLRAVAPAGAGCTQPVTPAAGGRGSSGSISTDDRAR